MVGESGCGKSTLAALLMRLEKPTAGAMHFDGVDVYELNRRDMRRSAATSRWSSRTRTPRSTRA